MYVYCLHIYIYDIFVVFVLMLSFLGVCVCNGIACARENLEHCACCCVLPALNMDNACTCAGFWLSGGGGLMSVLFTRTRNLN